MDRGKSFLMKAVAGTEGCVKLARALMGPFGPLPPLFKSQRIPEVARKRIKIIDAKPADRG